MLYRCWNSDIIALSDLVPELHPLKCCMVLSLVNLYVGNITYPRQRPQHLPLQAEVILQRARVELERAKATQQKYANRKRRPVEFQVGDYLWLKVSHLPMSGSANSRALSLKYRGPFKIISRVGQWAYRLQLPPSMWMHPVFHVSLKPVTM
ncbi:hypothetical protein CSUI_005946, partial [Cystoisospora suis]